MLNGLTERDPQPTLQPQRSALMQPLQTFAAGWMPCSVSSCLRRCLRGTSLADQCLLNGATTDRRMGAKNKTASASLCSFRAALFGADKAAALLRTSPGVEGVTSVWPPITNWTVPPHGILSLSRHEIQWPSWRGAFSNYATGYRPTSERCHRCAGGICILVIKGCLCCGQPGGTGSRKNGLRAELHFEHLPPVSGPPFFSSLDLLPVKLPHRTVQGQFPCYLNCDPLCTRSPLLFTYVIGSYRCEDQGRRKLLENVHMYCWRNVFSKNVSEE